MPNFEHEMAQSMLDDKQEKRRQEQLAAYEEELASVDKRLAAIESIRQAIQAAQAAFKDHEIVPEQLQRAEQALEGFEASQDFAGLVERKRQLKQLIVTSKLDLGTGGTVERESSSSMD